MKNTKLSYQLGIVLAVLTLGIISVFWVMFPMIGRNFIEPGGEYNRFYLPFTLWSIGASIPLLYSINKLFKVVLNIYNDVFFDRENVKYLFTCYHMILRTDLTCCFMLLSAAYIDYNPLVFIICVLLAIVGFIVAQFFKILAIWVERGMQLKEELDLTI